MVVIWEWNVWDSFTSFSQNLGYGNRPILRESDMPAIRQTLYKQRENCYFTRSTKAWDQTMEAFVRNERRRSYYLLAPFVFHPLTCEASNVVLTTWIFAQNQVIDPNFRLLGLSGLSSLFENQTNYFVPNWSMHRNKLYDCFVFWSADYWCLFCVSWKLRITTDKMKENEEVKIRGKSCQIFGSLEVFQIPKSRCGILVGF